MRREYSGWGAFHSFSSRAQVWLTGSIFPAVTPSLLSPYSPARRHRPHPTEQKLRINQIFKSELEKSKEAKAADTTTFEQNKAHLV